MICLQDVFKSLGIVGDRRLGLLRAAALLSICALFIPVLCQASPAGMQPDVLVIVLTGFGQADRVSVNYTSEVPKEQARVDLRVIVGELHGPLRGEEITTESGAVPGAKATTSSVFEGYGIVNMSKGRLSIEPFVIALKRFKSIQVNFLVGQSFGFRGPKDFENKYVKIRLKQSGNSYLYNVDVRDANFERLELPRDESGQENRRPSRWPRVMLILGLAVAAAAVAYLITILILKRRA